MVFLVKQVMTLIDQVADFIEMITKLEKKEYNNYLDWLYHEMERQID